MTNQERDEAMSVTLQEIADQCRGVAEPGFGISHGVRAMTAVEAATRSQLRDKFAGQALIGMLSRGFVPRQFLDDKPDEGPAPPRDYAVIAYRIAEAMLAARSANQEHGEG